MRAYILAGLAFMLLPGTFLGVWNLCSLSSDTTHHALSPAWVQAHGHAQIFGWIGTFVIGIGFFSLSKMGPLQPKTVSRGWLAWTLWVGGVLIAWATGVYGWQWRAMLPASALLECAGYLIFFGLVRNHRPAPQLSNLPILRPPREAWMRLVGFSSMAFLTALIFRAIVAVFISFKGAGPQFPPAADRALLAISVWGFLVVSIWGFNARWLALFAGFRRPNDAALVRAAQVAGIGILSACFGAATVSATFLFAAALLAIYALGIFASPANRAQAGGMYSSLPAFIRIAYCWLCCAAILTIWASRSDAHGGITGASRHAVTVGFIGTMVFAIGQRLLPTFCGQYTLFSKNVMIGAIAFLNLGCLLRVSCEIPAYEFHEAVAWALLPVSAVLELTAVSLFAFNLSASVLQPRPVRHFAAQHSAA